MRRRPLLACLLLALAPAQVPAEPLRYSGSLMESGAPANGEYALRMTLYDAPKGGHRIGKEITLLDVAVGDGAFATEVEFGMPLLSLERLWLQVEVAGADGRFESLGAREALDPKMMKAAGACWSTTGNSGTVAGTNFLGTTDGATQLEFRIANNTAMRFKFNQTTIGGSSANDAVSGGTIGGGGSMNSFPINANIVSDEFGTIGGGYGNTAGNKAGTVFDAALATVAGGAYNTSGGLSSVVSGGENNVATEAYSVIAGGHDNRTNGDAAVVAGGVSNAAAGTASYVAGGGNNCSGGDYSWTGGTIARVRPGTAQATGACAGVPLGPAGTGDEGTFIWADAQNATFTSSGPNQFLVRSLGGAAFNGTPSSDAIELSIFGNPPFGGFVELWLTPKLSLNGNTGESIELGVGVGGAGTNDANFRIVQRNAAAAFNEVLTIASNGVTSVVGGAVGTISDARLKKNIRGIDQPLDTLLALHGHVYEYLDPAKAMNAPGPRMGFIAQEVQQTLPNWVTARDDGYLQVSPIGFEALAVEAMRELADENVALQADNAALQAENGELRRAQAALAERLTRIEAQLEARTR